MAPATRTKPNSLAAEMAKKTKEMILDLHVKRMILERQNNNGRLPEGKMEDILDSLKSQGLDSLTRCAVCDHEQHIRLQQSRETDSVPGSVTATASIALEEVATMTDDGSAVTNGTLVNKGGRPRGTTVKARMDADKQLSDAIEFAATEILKEQNQAKSTSTKLAKGMIKSIIARAHDQHALKDNINIPRETVMSRVKRGNAKGWQGHTNATTPMHNVEPILAALCIKLVRSGTPLDKASFLELAISLVEGTPTEELIKDHKRRCKHDPNAGALLGVRHC